MGRNVKQGNTLLAPEATPPHHMYMFAKLLLHRASRHHIVSGSSQFPRGTLVGRCLNEEKIGYKST
jgi:hypothetical protein